MAVNHEIQDKLTSKDFPTPRFCRIPGDKLVPFPRSCHRQPGLSPRPHPSTAQYCGALPCQQLEGEDGGGL